MGQVEPKWCDDSDPIDSAIDPRPFSMIKKIAAFLICSVAVHAFADTYKTEDVLFRSHGVELSGTVVFPVDVKLLAGVVFVHGSGEQTRNLYGFCVRSYILHSRYLIRDCGSG